MPMVETTDSWCFTVQDYRQLVFEITGCQRRRPDSWCFKLPDANEGDRRQLVFTLQDVNEGDYRQLVFYITGCP